MNFTSAHNDYLDPDKHLPQDEPCDHEWTFHDESFDHEYGTEKVHFWECEKCGATTSKCPVSDTPFTPDNDLD